MVTVGKKDFRKIGKTGFGKQTAPQGIIFRRRIVVFITDVIFDQNRSADHRRRMADTATVDHDFFNFRIFRRKTADLIFRAENPVPAADHSDFRMGVQKSRLFFKPFGQRNVIMVKNRQIFAPGKPDQFVSRQRNSQIPVILPIANTLVIVRFNHLFHVIVR